MSQPMEDEDATHETLNYGCRIPASFASEKIGHILRREHSTQAFLISKAGMENRTLYRVYPYQGAAVSEAAGPQE